MLAQRLPSILPPLTPRELLEVSMIHSVAGALAGGALTDRRPFRAPHHSASMPALVGGGVHARPGEISLAHNGVLFLDELPEFQPQVLDSLRQPIESGEVAIARANHRVIYPARFQLVAAMNPCRCGSANEPGFACKRAPNERCVAQYLGRLSGPLIDRFDLVVDVPSVSAADLMTPPSREGSAEVAARVAAAREIQLARYSGLGLDAVACNAAAPANLIEEIAEADDAGVRLLRDAADRLRLSARGYHRVLKLARTLLTETGQSGARISRKPSPIGARRTARPRRPKSAGYVKDTTPPNLSRESQLRSESVPFPELGPERCVDTGPISAAHELSLHAGAMVALSVALMAALGRALTRTEARVAAAAVENDVLRDEVWRLKEGAAARDRTEAASEAKSRFLATMSHEIRTPISGILGMADLLRQASLTPESASYVEAIHSSGSALIALVDSRGSRPATSASCSRQSTSAGWSRASSNCSRRARKAKGSRSPFRSAPELRASFGLTRCACDKFSPTLLATLSSSRAQAASASRSSVAAAR
jgi:hypothetical protein